MVKTLQVVKKCSGTSCNFILCFGRDIFE